MTIAQKMRDERRMGFKEGRMETITETIAAFKGILEPDIIAEKLKVPLDQVLEIWGQV